MCDEPTSNSTIDDYAYAIWWRTGRCSWSHHNKLQGWYFWIDIRHIRVWSDGILSTGVVLRGERLGGAIGRSEQVAWLHVKEVDEERKTADVDYSVRWRKKRACRSLSMSIYACVDVPTIGRRCRRRGRACSMNVDGHHIHGEIEVRSDMISDICIHWRAHVRPS